MFYIKKLHPKKGTGPVKLQGSVGFDDMLDPRCKDHQLNDNVQKCLVNPVDMMCCELNKSDDKFDETVDVGVIVDRATLKASSVGFDDLLDLGTKDHLLNDNVPKGLVKSVDMMYGEDNTSDDKLDETVAVGVIVDRATPQSSPPPNAMEYQEPEPTDKGSVGFDDLLDPGFKDQLLNDNVPKGLVKLVEPMSGEDNISGDKLDETVAGSVIVDLATLQASPPPNAMQYQEPHPTDKMDAAVFVDVQVDRVLFPKNPSLINNVE
ncbi:hypothetical protein Tco_1486634, partial [Tanacetum coccineum]